MFRSRRKKIVSELFALRHAPLAEWFKGSQVFETTPDKPLMQFHGTCHTISSFRPFTHFSVSLVANAGVQLSRRNLGMATFTWFDPDAFRTFSQTDGAFLNQGITSGHIYPVYLRIKNPLEVWDCNDNHTADHLADMCRANGHLSFMTYRKIKRLCGKYENDDVERGLNHVRAFRVLRKALLKQGYDGMFYELVGEYPGYTAWINFFSSQVKWGGS
ncbi:MAG: hypothetical protein HQL35_03535 [Alphaproteobacteria bacterium]|nr:hypothetical protein [Alphaproteobacteria bacterium]